MKSNSKEYYLNQKKKSVLYWEKQRTRRYNYAFKKAFIDAIIYGLGIHIIIKGFPTLNNMYQYSIGFSAVFIVFYSIHYFFTFKHKEKYYFKTKKELKL